ncbi:hypothetical protein GCM10010381_65150 [Streptomyces xantholiticus]|nr:hypothetical protein GCM10010381_65150 [Streptomyces xantholiticus]
MHADRDSNCAGHLRRAEAVRQGPEAATQANERTAQARGKYNQGPSVSPAVKEQCNLDKALPKPPRDGAGVTQQPVVERDGDQVIPLRCPNECDRYLNCHRKAQPQAQ